MYSQRYRNNCQMLVNCVLTAQHACIPRFTYSSSSQEVIFNKYLNPIWLARPPPLLCPCVIQHLFFPCLFTQRWVLLREGAVPAPSFHFLVTSLTVNMDGVLIKNKRSGGKGVACCTSFTNELWSRSRAKDPNMQSWTGQGSIWFSVRVWYHILLSWFKLKKRKSSSKACNKGNYQANKSFIKIPIPVLQSVLLMII